MPTLKELIQNKLSNKELHRLSEVAKVVNKIDTSCKLKIVCTKPRYGEHKVITFADENGSQVFIDLTNPAADNFATSIPKWMVPSMSLLNEQLGTELKLQGEKLQFTTTAIDLVTALEDINSL